MIRIYTLFIALFLSHNTLFSQIINISSPHNRYTLTADFPLKPTIKNSKYTYATCIYKDSKSKQQRSLTVQIGDSGIYLNRPDITPSQADNLLIANFGGRFFIEKLDLLPVNTVRGYKIYNQNTGMYLYCTAKGDIIIITMHIDDLKNDIGTKFIQSFNLKIVK